jgi:YegS/Rv2252/BmrU family lipid kinase
MLQFLFVVNKGSGTNQSTTWNDVINNFFIGKDETFKIYNLPEKFETTQIKDHIAKEQPNNVIAVGGDGTVTMLANIIAGTNMALGILPSGSANGMAKELGIPENSQEALKIILEAKIKHCDLIKINADKYCLHLSDIGLNAHLIKHFDEGKLRGKLGYALVILKTLWQKEKMQVIIKTKDVEVRRNAFMVVLANATKYGTGAVINPHGNLRDGLFEVIIIRKLSLGTLLKMLLKPGIFNPKKIEIIPSTSVEITTLRRTYFQIDGEYQGRIKKVSAEICEGILKIIEPSTSSN